MHAYLSGRWLLGACGLLLLAACSSDDDPERQVAFPATVSVLSFDSANFIPAPSAFTSNSAFLQNGPRTVVRITGELSLPSSDAERLPAVILMHGGSGIGALNRQWVNDLNSIGLATFLVDSLAGRGLTGVSLMRALPRIIDAYQALAVLAQHPRIDPSRIALMGWSQGGFVSLYAGTERFQRLYKATTATFAAYIPFYPICNYALREDEARDGRPIRIFHGTADNMTPIGPCRDVVARLRQGGQDITLREFPGAAHAFDASLTAFTLSMIPGLPTGYTFASCALLELPNGVLANRETGQEFNRPGSLCPL